MDKITTVTEVGDSSDYSLPPFPRALSTRRWSLPGGNPKGPGDEVWNSLI